MHRIGASGPARRTFTPASASSRRLPRSITEVPMLTHRQSLVALTAGMRLLLFGSAVPAAQVNINTADAATLARELKGIGLKRAQDIIEYRQKHGSFRSVDELALVKGIGPAAISKNRES